MVEKAYWHPVARSDELAGAPLGVVLLGQRVVLWRDDGGQPHAWDDQCPHRGACLSLGRVHAGRLECPYHGWQFDAGGRCVQVPAVPSFVPPQSHAATVFAVAEQYGLIWVRLDPAEATAGVPPFVAEGDDALRKLNCGPYDVQTSAGRIVENFLDMAHFGFVHEGWLGSREFTSVGDYVVASTDTGLVVTECKAWQPQSNLHSTAPAQVEYTYAVTSPYTVVLTKVPEAHTVSLPGYREAIGLFVCPVTPQSSRVWFRMAVADHASADEKLRDFQHTIFMQDKPVLESQLPKELPLDVRAEVHTVADRASSAYRRFLAGLNFSFGVLK